MKYRKFGGLDWQGSVLGVGAMRLPVFGNNPADVDEAQSIQMIRYAIDHGVNYVDTAYPYHMGKGEPVVGKALGNGYRQKVKLATKLPSWMINCHNDMDRIFNEQLEKLQTPRIDFYLVHNLNHDVWTKLQDLHVLKWAEKEMAAGRIGYLGFSFHDKFDAFKEIVDAYDNWTFCQIQYNFMDEDYQAGTRGLKYAAGKGLAVVIMEPLRGGRLTKQPPESIARLWASAPQQRSLAEWGLRWVWSHPEVSVVLSGMSTIAQVVENVAIAERVGEPFITGDELKLIGKVRDAYQKLTPIPCTACGYCMPCPNGIEIPVILDLYNNVITYDSLGSPQFIYNSPIRLTDKQRAHNCKECKECLEKCPQGIPIPDWLKKAHELLAYKKKPAGT